MLSGVDAGSTVMRRKRCNLDTIDFCFGAAACPSERFRLIQPFSLFDYDGAARTGWVKKSKLLYCDKYFKG